ncbi:MAG: 4Fe-4S binding protein [Bdellovibrionales bacterium]|jgi:formate hydrogenlyase subunit 6/NADH:ubiquinone oxidoreductase subunit I|nr:4Fe-4S binding protein [Bdellovibrionales bacterium]MBT3525061.1 4Fe-4S binding protein [Bdellovibrionales bacterium]MBT7767418.1 4Fe-4S binding protein [Bdellovibrionales bacterium]
MILSKVLYLPKSYLGTVLDLVRQLIRIGLGGERVDSKVVEFKDGPLTVELPSMLYDSKGELLCDGCLLCQHHCPTSCILIELPANKVKSTNKTVPTAFYLDPYRCIYCQLCLEVCPLDALGLKGSSLGSETGGQHLNEGGASNLLAPK